MKHKTNVGPGLIVALGGGSTTGENNAGKMDGGSRAPGEGTRPTGPSALSDAANTDTVPLDMLSMPDDQEQMQPPEVGDVVSYQVTGKVVAIEGNDAKVQRQSINGQDVQEDNETNGENDNPQNANQSSDDDEGQSLRGQAAGIGMMS